MKNINKNGFTIIELMIATTVFSVVLLVAQVSFLQIGKLNTKGLTSTRTQSTATQVLAEIKSSVHTAPPNSISPNSNGNNYTYFCAGGNRFTYNLGRMLDLTTGQSLLSGGNGNYGILEDSLPGAGACAPPCDPSGSCPAGTTPFNSPTELLGNKMRVDRIDVSQANTNLYQIDLVIVYGEDGSLSQPTDPDNVTCAGDLSSQNFCYISRLSAYAFQGVSG